MSERDKEHIDTSGDTHVSGNPPKISTETVVRILETRTRP